MTREVCINGTVTELAYKGDMDIDSVYRSKAFTRTTINGESVLLRVVELDDMKARTINQ